MSSIFRILTKKWKRKKVMTSNVLTSFLFKNLDSLVTEIPYYLLPQIPDLLLLEEVKRETKNIPSGVLPVLDCGSWFEV